MDLAVINGNYAIQAGLKVSDALAVEDKDSIAAETYANVLVVKEGNEETDATKALIAALQSETSPSSNPMEQMGAGSFRRPQYASRLSGSTGQAAFCFRRIILSAVQRRPCQTPPFPSAETGAAK